MSIEIPGKRKPKKKENINYVITRDEKGLRRLVDREI